MAKAKKATKQAAKKATKTTKPAPPPVDFGAQSEVEKLRSEDAGIDVGAAVTHELPKPMVEVVKEGKGLVQKAKDRYRFRSSVDGEYVSADEAKADPDRTVRERVRKAPK